MLFRSNPTTTNVTIAIDNTGTGNTGTTIELFDLSGQLVFVQEYPLVLNAIESIELDLSKFKASMYFVRITNANQRTTLPLVKN